MSTHPEMSTVAPIILDPDYNPFLSNSGYDSGLEIGEILSGYSTACSAPPIAAPQLHAFPRSLSNSSNMSASSIDSIDGYHGMGDDDWIQPYSIHVSFFFLFSTTITFINCTINPFYIFFLEHSLAIIYFFTPLQILLRLIRCVASTNRDIYHSQWTIITPTWIPITICTTLVTTSGHMRRYRPSAHL